MHVNLRWATMQRPAFWARGELADNHSRFVVGSGQGSCSSWLLLNERSSTPHLHLISLLCQRMQDDMTIHLKCKCYARCVLNEVGFVMPGEHAGDICRAEHRATLRLQLGSPTWVIFWLGAAFANQSSSSILAFNERQQIGVWLFSSDSHRNGFDR
jgi:hypothetical protein